MTTPNINADRAAYTVFDNKSALSMRVVEQSWDKFCKQLESLKPSHKDNSSLVKFALFSGEKTKPTATTKGGCLRADEFVTWITGIEGDYDLEQVTPEQGRDMLEQHSIKGVIVTSHSHTPEKPRWRVFCPLSKAHTPGDRLRLIQRLNGALGGILSGESFTLSQSYFVGRPQHGGEYLVLRTNPIGESCLDELDGLDAIAKGKAGGTKTNTGSSGTSSDGESKNRREILEQLLHGEDVHGNALVLVGKWLARGMTDDEIRLLMESIAPYVADQRGPERAACLLGSELQRMIDGGRAKGYGKAEDTEPKAPAYKWPDPVDVFAEQVVPAFPLDCLPKRISEWAEDVAKQSGFDPGAYAFAALGSLCNSIDHRAKLHITQTWRQPAVLWQGLFDPSGGGKSAVKSAATKKPASIDTAKAEASVRALSRWLEKTKEKPAEGEKHPPKPPFKQRMVTDTTVEALAALLADNPEGVNMFWDEITEFIGRMDAYSGGNGGKDRGVYLRSYDGGPQTIHRASKTIPMQVDNFSVGIVAGMQPEKLAQLFKQRGSQSDGLYQRFLVYAFRPAGEVSFTARMNDFTEINFEALFDTIELWNNDSTLTMFPTELDADALARLESYTNQMRVVAKRTPAVRLREHLNRYSGFAARLTFGLHVIECADTGRYVHKVSLATLERALRIMAVMYRHSEAVYELLDSTQGDVLRLTRSAAEAILSKSWEVFKRGDLTRNATHWKGADAGHADGAIDYLIELGWIADITPERVRGKRGRKSDGVFMVNPDAPVRYQEHAVRIKQERAERYASIQEVAASKS